MEGVLFIRGAYKAPERGCWYILYWFQIHLSTFVLRNMSRAMSLHGVQHQQLHVAQKVQHCHPARCNSCVASEQNPGFGNEEIWGNLVKQTPHFKGQKCVLQSWTLVESNLILKKYSEVWVDFEDRFPLWKCLGQEVISVEKNSMDITLGVVGIVWWPTGINIHQLPRLASIGAEATGPAMHHPRGASRNLPQWRRMMTATRGGSKVCVGMIPWVKQTRWNWKNPSKSDFKSVHLVMEFQVWSWHQVTLPSPKKALRMENSLEFKVFGDWHGGATMYNKINRNTAHKLIHMNIFQVHLSTLQ